MKAKGVTTMTLGERIVKYMNDDDISMREFARRAGTSHQTIANVIKGDRTPDLLTYQKIAKGMGMSPADLFVAEAGEPTVTTEFHSFPIIGEVAAGYEHFAEYEDEYGSIDIPDSWLKGRSPADYFILRVSGDSMYPQFQDGDLVLVLKQSTMNYSGQIGVVVYDDNKATLKKVEYVMGEDWMRLVPINPAYPPVMVIDERLEHCRVLGIAKMVIRDIR